MPVVHATFNKEKQYVCYAQASNRIDQKQTATVAGNK